MPITCPKCLHQRTADDDPLIPDYQCPKCGVVYAKIGRPDLSKNVMSNIRRSRERPENLRPAVFEADGRPKTDYTRRVREALSQEQTISIKPSHAMIGVFGGALVMLSLASAFKSDVNDAAPQKTAEIAASNQKRIENDARENQLKIENASLAGKKIKNNHVTNAHEENLTKENVILPNPLCKFDKNKTEIDIKNDLQKKYPGSYSLQKTLLDGHIDALNQLCLQHPSLNIIETNLVDDLIKTYYPSWSLIKTLFDKNMEDYGRLYGLN